MKSPSMKIPWMKPMDDELTLDGVFIWIIEICIGVFIGVHSEDKTKPVIDKISHASHTNNIRKRCFHINSSELQMPVRVSIRRYLRIEIV